MHVVALKKKKKITGSIAQNVEIFAITLWIYSSLFYHFFYPILQSNQISNDFMHHWLYQCCPNSLLEVSSLLFKCLIPINDSTEVPTSCEAFLPTPPHNTYYSLLHVSLLVVTLEQHLSHTYLLISPIPQQKIRSLKRDTALFSFVIFRT